MVNFKLRRRKNDGRKKQESGIHSGVQTGGGAIGSGRPGMFGDRQRVLGIPKQTLENWVRQAAKGKLAGAGAKPVSAEQMELARLRAELARVKMGRDILKKAAAYFARESA